MTFKRWLPTFLAFPIGGLVAIETLGSLHDPTSAAIGGLVTGAIIGAGQWLALRTAGIGRRWIGVTAAAMAASSAVAAAITGAGTEAADIMLFGLVTGAAVGAAQAPLIAGGPGIAAAWTVVTGGSWSLAWLVTSGIIVDIERGYYSFGAGGAAVATVATGLVLRHAAQRDLV